MSNSLSSSPSAVWTVQPSSPRKGGILLRPQDSAPCSPVNKTAPLPSPDAKASHVASSSAVRPSALGRGAASSSSGSDGTSPTASQVKIADQSRLTREAGRPTTRGRPASISFAPLPDPRQQRSLSTGRNVRLAATLGPGGERTEELQTSGGSSGGDLGHRRASDDSGLLDGVNDDDDDDDLGAAADASDEDDGKKRRSSILGSSWSKSTKKFFGRSSSSSASKKFDRTSSIESSHSANSMSELSSKFSSLTRSLSPSVSRGSTHSDTTSDRRARLLASLSPTTSRTGVEHESLPAATPRHWHSHNNSLEVPSGGWNAPSSLGRGVIGARMLNGRAYGVRGGIEAIRKAEEEALRGPEFQEWGSVGSMGSNSTPVDDDDGSGMSWARKRREAREKAAAERAAAEALKHPPSSDSSSPLTSPTSEQGPLSPITPMSRSADLPASFNSIVLSESDLDDQMAQRQAAAVERKARANSHDVHAVAVPGHMHTHARVPDADGLKTPTAATFESHATVAPIGIEKGGSHGRDGDSDEDEDDLDSSSESDGDNASDDEDDDDEDSSEEAAMDEARKTAMCAGVEVVSRHKSIPS